MKAIGIRECEGRGFSRFAIRHRISSGLDQQFLLEMEWKLLGN
jgi:hypothetical protein